MVQLNTLPTLIQCVRLPTVRLALWKLCSMAPAARPAPRLPWGALAVVLLCASCLVPGVASAAQKKKPAPPKPAADSAVLIGTVSRVVDGDTFWLKVDGHADRQVVVRIAGIDAPESCQAGGSEATAALNDLALGRKVTVRVVDRDDFGRTVGKVFDGAKDIGDRMVRDGQAWSIRFKYDRGPYVAEERMAHTFRRGLHAAGDAMEPLEFRRQHGPCNAADAKAPAASGSKPMAVATRT
jgi:endonuclease YncB( thermonuclease family)